MLCLLPILRKVRKLKHNYIIVMRPKLYTRKKKIRGGNTAVMSRSRLDDIGPRVDNMVNNAVANVDPYALQMKAKNAVMAQADAIQTAATNTADNLKVVATLDPNAAQMRAENAAKLEASKLKGQIAAKLRAEKAAAVKAEAMAAAAKSVMPDPNVVKAEAMAAAEAKAIADTARNTAETKEATKDMIEDTAAENKETTEEEKEERAAAEAQAEREAEKAALIAALKEEIEEIERKLEELKPDITRIYEKSKESNNNKSNESNLTVEELTPEEFEKFETYIDLYKKLIEKNDELYNAENSSTEEWSVTSLILSPVKNFFGNLLGNVKKMGAKATMASVTGMTGFVVQCYEEIQPNLIKFAQLKNETQQAVMATTSGAAQLGINGLAKTGPTGELSAAALNGAIETGSPTEAMNGATKGVINQALVMSGPIADPNNLLAATYPAAGGGRRSNPNNLKEVQRGGLAAAKRVENSIKQFLGSSVSSSHILNMVKRKTMVKRKRESKGIRQSRKRAKNQ